MTEQADQRPVKGPRLKPVPQRKQKRRNTKLARRRNRRRKP